MNSGVVEKTIEIKVVRCFFGHLNLPARRSFMRRRV